MIAKSLWRNVASRDKLPPDFKEVFLIQELKSNKDYCYLRCRKCGVTHYVPKDLGKSGRLGKYTRTMKRLRKHRAP